MKTVHLNTVIGADGKVHLDVPCELPPGPAEVVVVIQTVAPDARKQTWKDFYGVGKEIWQGEDAQAYVNRLRDEWER